MKHSPQTESSSNRENRVKKNHREGASGYETVEVTDEEIENVSVFA